MGDFSDIIISINHKGVIVMELNELKQKLDQANYIYDDILATTLYVALKLGRPLLFEGAAGVG